MPGLTAARVEVAAATRRTTLQRVMLAARILFPLAALAYLLSIVPLDETIASLRAIPPRALIATFLIGNCAVFVAAVRWRLLFAACGIAERPSALLLFRLHLIGQFYNAFLPGGLGGDVVRAIATRKTLGERGLTGALAVVFLERTFGAAALLILVVVTFTLFPLRQIPNVALFSALGLAAAAAAVIGIASGPRIARFLPAPLSKVASSLPTIERFSPFVAALLLSLVTQSTVIIVGHMLLVSLTDAATLTDSCVILPLIGASQYFPLTVGGAGVREAAFVLLYGLVGVPKPVALATSLAFAGVLYAISAVGGLLHALRPLDLGIATSAQAPREGDAR
jgi:uncharacterized membrane protein YbhN (UPF0104 family)